MKLSTSIVCPQADCPMSGVCARYADYLLASEEKETFTVLNPQWHLLPMAARSNFAK